MSGKSKRRVSTQPIRPPFVYYRSTNKRIAIYCHLKSTKLQLNRNLIPIKKEMKSTTQSKCFYSIKAAAAACWINWKSAIRRRLPTLAACLLFVRLPTPSAFDYGRDQRVGGGMDRTSTLCALIGYISAGSTVVKWCVPVAVQHVTCASSSIDSDEERTRADGHRRHQFIIISRWFSYRQSRWPATVLLKPMKLLVEKDWTGGQAGPLYTNVLRHGRWRGRSRKGSETKV